MGRWIKIAFGLICAAVLTQVPTYHQQYLQRLGGHVDELALQVQALDERAGKVGTDRYGYIRDFIASDNLSVQSEGQHLLATVTRHVTLSNSLKRLSEMGMLYVGAAMMVEIDPPIALATLKTYKPAVPLTTAGLGYGVAGFFIGFFGLMLLISLFSWKRVPVPEEEARERG